MKLENINSRRLEFIFILILLSICSWLFLSNLGNQYLWQDEAQTALIGKTVLASGVPLGYDGKNFLSQELGAEYGQNYIWKWHTWLQFYLVAAFFKIFGINTLAARLPFALFGIATVLLSYIFAKSLWKSKRAAAIAALLILSSVAFLVLSRQSRYYSVVTFFSLWGLYNFLNLLENKKYAAIMFVLSTVLLFHTHYLYCATLLFTILIYTLFFYRNKLRLVLSLLAIVTLINLPWLIWLATAKYTSRYTPILIFSAYGNLFPRFLYSYLMHIKENVVAPLLLLIFLLVAIFNYLRTKTAFSKNYIMWKNMSLLLFFCIVTIITLSLFSPSPFFRYLTVLIPVILIIIAQIINSIINVNGTIGICIVLLFFSRSFFCYLYEITHDYDGPIEGIVEYLKQNGKETDTVAITYGDMPVKFYTKMRVVGGLTGEDLTPAQTADWVIIRKHAISRDDYKVREYLRQNVPWHKYQRIVIDYPDIPFENREDLKKRHYKTVQNQDKVVIYQRVSEP